MTRSTKPATQKANFDSCAKTLRKFRCETFHRKISFNSFRKLAHSILSAQCLVGKCLRKHAFISDSAQTRRSLHFLLISLSQKNHLVLKLVLTATELWERSKFDIYQKPLFCTSASNTNFVLKAVPTAAGQYILRGFETICRLFHVLALFPFPISESELG